MVLQHKEKHFKMFQKSYNFHALTASPFSGVSMNHSHLFALIIY